MDRSATPFTDVAAPSSPDFTTPSPFRGLKPLFLIEAFGSIASNLLMIGVYFFMQNQYHWQSRSNLLLASTQGAVYVIGALAANPLAATLGRTRLLRRANFLLAILTFAGFLFPGEKTIAAIVLAYAMCSAVQWPALESLVSSDASADDLSRRISVYNIVWSGAGALTVAVSGTIIHFYPPGILLLASSMHLASLIVLAISSSRKEISEKTTRPHAAVSPEPELLALRTLAMQLSRVALPATFAVLYSLGAMMPTLPVIREFPSEMQTLVGSVWMMSRWLAFVLLAVTSWWHTRPRALLMAAFIMLLAFLAITLRISIIAPWLHFPAALDPLVMILAQIVLGLVMGLIYCASLYFGMVLSEGSTEHGGYHEALIGLGTILGPGAGALAQFIRPASQGAGIFAVTIVIWISVMLAAGLSLQLRRKMPDKDHSI